MKKRFLSVVITLALVLSSFSGFSMVSADTMSLGDVLAQKFVGKDKLNVCFVGGSITEGTGASSLDKSYASQVAEHLEKVSPIPIEYFNAGIGGTGSDFGILRLNNDVLRYNPDIVFVEFAINDVGTNQNVVKKNMEGIVRQIRAKNEKTAVIFIYTTDNKKQAVTALHQEVADHYGIYAINIQDYVWGLCETEGISIDTYLKDGVHPNDAGHKLYAEYINSQLDSHANEAISFVSSATAAFGGDDYKSPRFADMTEVNAEGANFAVVQNKKQLELTNGAEVTYSFEGRVIGAYPVYPTAENSTLTYKIDNGEEQTVNLQNKKWFYVFANGLDDTNHTLTLKANTTGSIYIGNFMVDDGEAQYIKDNSNIVNAGFEIVDGGRDAGWEFANESLSGISSEEKNTDAYSLKLAGIGNSISQVIKVKPNTTYSLSFYVKFNENCVVNETNFIVKVNNSTTDNTRYNLINNTIKASKGNMMGFRHISYTFTTGGEESLKIIFAANDPYKDTLKAVYVDDVAIMEHGIYPIANNGFENGLTAWYNQSDIAVVAKDPDDSANHAAYVEGGNQLFSQTVKVEQNADYIVSFRYKNNSSLAKTGEFQVQNSSKTPINRVNLESKSSWTSASVNFNSGSNDSVILSMYTAQGVNAYYDDFYIIKTEVGQIANGDFESGELGWNLKTGASIEKAEGNAYMKHHVDGGSVYMERSVAVNAETDYMLSFRYRVDRIHTKDKAMAVSVKQFPGAIESKELSDGWQYGFKNFNSGTNTSVDIAIYTGPDATVLYDDFKLSKIESGDIVNGDFESGFIGWKDNGTPGTLKTENGDTYLSQKNSTAPYILNKVQLPYAGTYTLSFRYSVSGGSDGDKLAVISMNGQQTKIDNNTEGWTEKEVEFTGKEGENILSIWTASNIDAKYDDFVIKYFNISTVSDTENQNISFNVSNKSGEEKQVTFIAAYYDADKTALIKIAEIKPESYANHTSATYTYTVPDGETSGMKLRVFAFDNLSNINPLADFGEITVQ